MSAPPARAPNGASADRAWLRGARHPRAVPRLAGAGCRRHDATCGPISPSAPPRWCSSAKELVHPGPLLHQHGLRPPALRRRRRRLARRHRRRPDRAARPASPAWSPSSKASAPARRRRLRVCRANPSNPPAPASAPASARLAKRQIPRSGGDVERCWCSITTVPAATGGRSMRSAAVRGLRVLIDGPVGCENLPVTAVLHYTDGLPPHELPVARHRPVGRQSFDGRHRRVRCAARHASRRPGPARGRRHRQHRGDDRRRRHAGGQQPAALHPPHHRRGPVAGGRPRHLLAVDRIRPRQENQDQAAPAERAPGARPRVNIIGPIYGTFNMPSDLAEIRRLVEGVGCEINLWCSRSAAHVEDIAKLPDADVNICLYREFGSKALRGARSPLSAGADRHLRHHQFPARAGRAHRCIDPEPFIEAEKHTTIKPIWDLWRSVTQDFFATATFAVVATDTYARGRENSSCEDELGVPCTFAFSRTAGTKPDNAMRCASALKSSPPLVLYGSFNERMYAAELGSRCMFIAGLVPRRHHPPRHRHPVHGLRRRHLHRSGILQRPVRCAVPHPAARPPRWTSTAATPTRAGEWNATPRGTTTRSPCSTRMCETEPFIVRISAAKRLRDRVEQDARAAREGRVSGRPRAANRWSAMHA